jgi:hypothetical protein
LDDPSVEDDLNDGDSTDNGLEFTLSDDAEGRFAIDGDKLIVVDSFLLDDDVNASHTIEVLTSRLVQIDGATEEFELSERSFRIKL